MTEKMYTLSLNCARCNETIQSVQLSWNDLLESVKITEELGEDLYLQGAIYLKWDLNEPKLTEVVLCHRCVVHVKNAINIMEQKRQGVVDGVQDADDNAPETPEKTHKGAGASQESSKGEKVNQGTLTDDDTAGGPEKKATPKPAGKPRVGPSKKVKELRDRTGASMLACSKALTNNDGDVEKAYQQIRNTGLASATKESAKEKPEDKRPISQRYPLTERQRRIFTRIARGNTTDSGLARGKKGQKPLALHEKSTADLLCDKGLLRKDKNQKQYHLTADGRKRYEGMQL